MPGYTAVVRRFAALTAVALMAAAEQTTLDWPSGRESQLPSPDGRHIVYGEPQMPGTKDAPELWLRHAGRSDPKRLIQLGSTARAFWFLDSRNFLVIDRESSSGMTSYLYDAEGKIMLDMRAALLRHDPELKAVANGHFYVEARRLVDANTVRVAAFGHTDEPPVRCFRFIFAVNRAGEIERLSKRISPATATACDEQSE
jgi:hypothetical protein